MATKKSKKVSGNARKIKKGKALQAVKPLDEGLSLSFTKIEHTYSVQK